MKNVTFLYFKINLIIIIKKLLLHIVSLHVPPICKINYWNCFVIVFYSLKKFNIISCRFNKNSLVYKMVVVENNHYYYKKLTVLKLIQLQVN